MKKKSIREYLRKFSNEGESLQYSNHDYSLPVLSKLSESQTVPHYCPKNTGAPLLSGPRASKGFLPRRAEHQHASLLPPHTCYWWSALDECSSKAGDPFFCPAFTYGTEMVPWVQHAKIVAHWSLWSQLGTWWFHAWRGKPRGPQVPASHPPSTGLQDQGPTHRALLLSPPLPQKYWLKYFAWGKKQVQNKNITTSFA